MKMSFKSLTFLNKSLHFFEKVFKKPRNLSTTSPSTSPINEKNLHLSGNNFKKPEFFEKASHHFKKVSIPLKMSSKSLVIFIKTSHF
jgi:hypothetical protein